MAFGSDNSSFCNLVQKLKFENEASSVCAAQQRHCRALRSLAVLNFQKALDLNDASLSTAILEHGLQKYSRAVDAKASGTNSILVRETIKDADSRTKVDRAAWKSGLAGLKLRPTCEWKVSEEEMRSWHLKVTERTKRIEQRTLSGLEAMGSRPPKRKMPPSQDVSECDSPPPPPPSNKFNTVFAPREWQSKKPSQEHQSSIKSFLQPPSKQNQWNRQNTFERQPSANEPSSGNSWHKSTAPPIRSNQNAPREQTPQQPPGSAFKSARVELAAQNVKKYGHSGGVLDDPPKKKSLGGRRGPPPTSTSNKYVPHKSAFGDGSRSDDELDEEFDERLKNIAPEMVKMIRNEIMDVGKPVSWDDISGLESVKATIQEIVVWPLLRPDIFAGLRGPPKGILLFGPPGTGKTLIGKCIASQSKSTFFSISASSLTSKWVGDGEKMVRALFAVARCHQPAVIFIDEIDSLLSQRSETEHESSRRIKTEFLVQLDGATTCEEERILVVGATNRPQELDEAARRRLVKRLYVALPEAEARAQMITRLMAAQQCSLSEQQVQQVARLAQGFSGADMRHLCREAAYGPIRAISHSQIQHIQPQQVRPVALEDFTAALQHVRPSVSSKDLGLYQEWNNTYGYGFAAT